METQNYSFRIEFRERVPRINILIYLSDNFVDFAKSQDINKELYESITEENMRVYGWDNFIDKNKGSLCNWGDNSGLLHYISLPGNASSMCLENGLDGWAYHSHNIDTEERALVGLSVLSRYLSDTDSNLREA